jgi:hypothetical protein
MPTVGQLLPWQTEFIDIVEGSGTKAVFLDAAPGTGKPMALLGLALHYAEQIPEGRILFATYSRSLFELYRSKFSELAQHRHELRSWSKSDYWDTLPSGRAGFAAGVSLVTHALLRRLLDDRNFVALSWDLVILEGPAKPSSKLFDFVASGVRSKKIRKLVVADQSRSVADWGLPDAVTHRVALSEPTLPKAVEPIPYRLSENESQVRAAALAIVRPMQSWHRRISLAADSSQAALEQALLSLRNEIVHSTEVESLTYDGPGDEENREPPEEARVFQGAALQSLEALRLLYAATDDSKYDALEGHLRANAVSRGQVFTAFEATREYLDARFKRTSEFSELRVSTRAGDLLNHDPEIPVILYDVDWQFLDVLRSVRAAPMSICAMVREDASVAVAD